MPPDCYRCGSPVPDQAPFCPGCGAPQIRVTAKVAAPADPPETLDQQDLLAAIKRSPAIGEIQWRDFLRLAFPVAAITAFAAVSLPYALVLIIPASLWWSLWRYQRQHPGRIRAAIGAKLGATMGLLSFMFFLLFTLVAIASNRSEFHEGMIKAVHDAASRNPDPQVQDILKWALTDQGILWVTAAGFFLFLLFFLAYGALSGAIVGWTFRRDEGA